MRMFIISLIVSFLASIVSVCFAKEDIFCSNEILAKEMKNGFTWTIASRLGDTLHKAETRFGKRDPSWTILGVEYTNLAQPNIWYPNASKNRKHLIIQLTKRAAIDKKVALYQLSHEVIHAMSPSGDATSSVFEEGLAMYFAITNLQDLNYDIDENYISGKKYKQAYKLIENLYKSFPNAEQRIRSLRGQVAKTTDITADQFSTAFSGLNKDYANLLATKYADWNI